MSNELVVIEESNALTVLSTEDGVSNLIEDVRSRVMSLEGGNLETASGRKKIRSNAFKATKAKTEINNRYIKPLIQNITEKIQPDLDKIQALKDSKKLLDAGLDNIRKEVNEEVQAIDDAIAAKEAEEVARIEAEKVAAEIEQAHEVASLLNEKFDRELAEKLAKEKAERIEAERIAEQQRIEREEELKRQAAEQARINAERKAKEEQDRIEREKQEAINREEEARKRAEQAERDRIAAEERAKIQAEQAEAKRIADIEAAKQAEIQRQIDEENARKAEQERLEANKRHSAKIHNAMKDAFMIAGLDEDNAVKAVKALVNKVIPNIGSVQY